MELLLLVLSPAGAWAEISAGMKAGFSVARFWGDDADFEGSISIPALPSLNVSYDMNARLGFCALGYISLGVNDVFFVQPEAGIGSRGASYEVSMMGNTSESETQLYYLDFPLLLKVRIPTYSPVMPAFAAGPQLSVCVAAEADDGDNEQDLRDNISDVDFGFATSAGLDIEVPFGFMTVEIRYGMGFLTISEDDEDAEIFNFAFSFMAGFAYAP